MAGNEVVLTIAGDASSATRALGQAEQAMEEVGSAATTMNRSIGSAEDAFETAAREAGGFGAALDRANGAASILSGGIGDIGGAMTAFTDLEGLAESKALAHEKALLAVEKAQAAYDKAVKEFGANSMQAREAQLALTEAQQAAEPPTAIQEWGEKLELISPIIMGIVGVTDLLILSNTALSASWVRTAAAATASRIATIAGTVATGIATAAQWLWNIAMTANPIGLIIVAVAALVAGIVWLATQTDFFAKAWDAIWKGIVAYFEFVVGFYKAGWNLIVDAGKTAIGWFQRIPSLLKSAFSTVFDVITAPWRAAFNFIATAWNNTVGRLRWTIPSWVPGVGGNTISAPTLPRFHTGGVVPGLPGSTVHAELLAGERVTPIGGDGGGEVTLRLVSDGTPGGDLLLALLQPSVRRAGGPAVAFGGRHG